MNIDIIGTLYEPTGNVLKDDEGMEYPEMQPISGFHINTDALIEGADDYLVKPTIPRRVFAGVETKFYCFPSEEVFRQFVPEGVVDDE